MHEVGANVFVGVILSVGLSVGLLMGLFQIQWTNFYPIIQQSIGFRGLSVSYPLPGPKISFQIQYFFLYRDVCRAYTIKTDGVYKLYTKNWSAMLGLCHAVTVV